MCYALIGIQFKFIFVLCCFNSNEVLIPRILWAQRKEVVYVTIEVFEVKEEKIEIKGNVVSFSGVRGSDGAKFGVTLELFDSVDEEKSKVTVGHRDISLILVKTEAGPFWPRLLKSTQKMHFIHTDFSKWIDEDEEDEEMSADAGGFGNFDMSQFGGAGGNFDMSQFGGGADNFEDEEAQEFSSENEGEEEEEEDCNHENCSHTEGSEVKISGLTKNNEALDS